MPKIKVNDKLVRISDGMMTLLKNVHNNAALVTQPERKFALIDARGKRTMSAHTVRALMRVGLLESDPADTSRVVLTPTARQTLDGF